MVSHLMVNKFFFCLVLITLTTGCTTMRSLPTTDDQSLASQIQVSDKVKIIRNDSSDVTFKVDAISNEGVSGDGVFVAYSNIREVEVRQFSSEKTAVLAVGLGAALAALLASTESSAGPSGPKGG